MADNKAVTGGVIADYTAATDQTTYSGDTVDVPIARLVHVTGAEGSKVVSELVKLEDAAHTSGDPGFQLLTVRQDTAAALAGTDADYQPLITDSSGRLHTNSVVSAVTPGTAAANLGKAEDAAHSSGDTGVMALSVRKDTAASTAGTDGDYAGLVTDDTGRLYTTVQTVIPGTSATSLGKAEDAAHTSGDVGVAMFGVRSDTTPSSTSGTAGDYSLPNLDANGRLYVNATLYSAAGAALTPDTQGQQDTALGTITSVTGSMAFGRASTAAPTAVSADDDAVLPWYTKEGKVVTTTSPHTAGGLSTFMASGSDGSSILVATAQAIKSSAGQLYGYYGYNPEAAVTFVHFYNTAAGNVTVGTTNPLFTIALPAGAAANMTFPFGVTFSNAGWSCAATTTAGGNTAPSTGVSLVAWYA